MKLHASGTTATSADVHLVYGNEGGVTGGVTGAGAPAGVTELLDDEKSESKTVLLNFTVNVYAVPFDNPVTTIGDPDPVCEIELGDETTV